MFVKNFHEDSIHNQQGEEYVDRYIFGVDDQGKPFITNQNYPPDFMKWYDDWDLLNKVCKLS